MQKAHQFSHLLLQHSVNSYCCVVQKMWKQMHFLFPCVVVLVFVCAYILTLAGTGSLYPSLISEEEKRKERTWSEWAAGLGAKREISVHERTWKLELPPERALLLRALPCLPNRPRSLLGNGRRRSSWNGVSSHGIPLTGKSLKHTKTHGNWQKVKFLCFTLRCNPPLCCKRLYCKVSGIDPLVYSPHPKSAANDKLIRI